MSEVSLSHSKYSYNHSNGEGPFQTTDVHNILLKRSRLWISLSYFGLFVFLTTCGYLITMKELCASSILMMLSCFLLAKFLHFKPVKKESVVIMPAFGVQLETHYWKYVFGITQHIPRLEDWPVMPVERIGFMRMPHGFFNCSPAVDVPPSTSESEKDVASSRKLSQNALLAKV